MIKKIIMTPPLSYKVHAPLIARVQMFRTRPRSSHTPFAGYQLLPLRASVEPQAQKNTVVKCVMRETFWPGKSMKTAITASLYDLKTDWQCKKQNKRVHQASTQVRDKKAAKSLNHNRQSDICSIWNYHNWALGWTPIYVRTSPASTLSVQ